MPNAITRRFKGYRASYVPHDLIAGIVVAALSIPVAMGYAQIAGLPPVYGLYASILPPIVYALVTTSRRIVFGMDSAASAATGGVVAAAGVVLGSNDALSFVPILTLFTSLWLMAFSLIRAGRLMSYVPIPVMHGFITGISASVVIDQLPLLIGTNVTIGDSFGGNVAAIAASIPQADPTSCLLAIISLALLLLSKKAFPKLPAALLVLLAGMAATALLHLDEKGVTVLGSIDPGLPALYLPSIPWSEVPAAIGCSLTIAVVVSAESLLALDTFAMKDGHRARENRELASFGIANLFSAFSGCAPCSASISRTAAGEAAGGRTEVVSLTAAGAIALVVAFLAPYLYYLPQPILGAIVVAALLDVVNFRKIRRYAKHMRIELAIFLSVMAMVLVQGTIAGVLTGIALSFLTLLYRTHSTAQRGFLGVVENEAGYHPIGAASKAAAPKGTLIYRFATPTLSFANVNALVDEISDEMRDETTVIVIDIANVADIDTTATDRIIQFIDMVDKHDVGVRLVRPVTLADDEYTRFEIKHLMNMVKVYPSIDDALRQIPQKREHLVEGTLD